MYRHTSTSIKETQDKMFVSQSEKDKWNNKAESVHQHDDIYYTKEEILEKTDKSFLKCNGNVVNAKSSEGYVENLKICGNTVHFYDTLYLNGPSLYPGGIAYSDGSDRDDITHCLRTDFLPIEYGDTLYFIDKYVAALLNVNVLFYDENKNFIKTANSEAVSSCVVDLVNIKYFRIYAHAERMERVKIRVKRNVVEKLVSVGSDTINNGKCSLSVNVCGKNLLNVPSLYERYITFGNGVSKSYRVAYCKIDHNTDYTISFQYSKSIELSNHGGIYVGLFEQLPDEYDVWYNRQIGHQIHNYEVNEQNISKSFNSQTYNYLAVYIGVGTSSTYNHTATIRNLQLEKGTSKTEYEEYNSIQTTIELPFELEGIGNTTDKLFVREDGMLCVEKAIGTYKFTGDEPFFDGSSMSNGLTYCVRMQLDHTHNMIPNIKHDTGKMIMSNKFIGILEYRNDVECIFNGTAGFVTNILKSKLDSTMSTVEGFKAWIRENDYCIKYIYDVPEIIELGRTNDLVIKTFNGITNIYVDNNVPNRIECAMPTSIKNSISSINTSIIETNNIIDDLAKNVDIYNNVTVSGVAANISEHNIPGFTSDMVIKGRTMVNRIDDVATWTTDGGGTVSSGSYDIGVKISPNGILTRHYTSMILKPYTTYIASITCRTFGNTPVSVNIRYSDNINSEVDKCLCTFVKDDITTKTIKFSTQNSQHVTLSVESETDSSIQLSNVSVYDNYLESLQSGKNRFDGLLSVDPKLSIVAHDDSNLFDGAFSLNTSIGDDAGRNVSVYDCVCSKEYIVIPDNTNVLYFGMKMSNSNFHSVNMYFYGKEMEYLGYKFVGTPSGGNIDGEFSISTNVNVIPGTKYVRFRVFTIADVDNMEITEAYVNTYGNVYKPYNGVTKKVTLESALRSLPNGVADTIEKVNGKYCVVRRTGLLQITGNEPLHLLTSDDENIRMWAETSKYGKKLGSIICNRLPQGNSSNDRNNQYIMLDHNGNMVIAILKSNLSDPTYESAVEWIKNNNLFIVYESKNITIEPLDIDINMKIFDTATTIEFRNEGILQPIFSYSIPQNINDSIHSIMSKVEKLEAIDIYNTRTQLNSIFMTDKLTYTLTISLFSEDDGNKMNIGGQYNIYELISTLILSGKENYDRLMVENQIDFYTITGALSFDMAEMLFDIIDEQHRNQDFEQEIEC